MPEPVPTQSSRGPHDSPRWCGDCQRWGTHHTDRCPNRSTCCRAEVKIEGSGEGTFWMACAACRRPLDPATKAPA